MEFEVTESKVPLPVPLNADIAHQVFVTVAGRKIRVAAIMFDEEITTKPGLQQELAKKMAAELAVTLAEF